MKNVIALILFSICISVTNAQIRKTKWGMTKSQVIAAEANKPILNNESGLFYDTYLNNNKVYLLYMFTNEGKLSKIAYSLNSERQSNDNKINIFLTLAGLLEKKYGEVEFDFNVKSDSIIDKSTSWEDALKSGDLEVSKSWETDDTKITCEIKTVDFELKTQIFYYSKVYDKISEYLNDL